MTETENGSRCKRVQEGKRPLRACTLCRRRDCLVWQQVLEKARGMPSSCATTAEVKKPIRAGEDNPAVSLCRTPHEKITLSDDELRRNVAKY